MKKIFLFIIISTISCFGQDSIRSANNSLNSIYAIDATFLNEKALSFRYRFKERFSWKVGVDLSAYFSDGKSVDSPPNADLNKKSFGLRLNNQICYNFFQNDFLAFHFDVGPTLNYWQEIRSEHSEHLNQTYSVNKTIFEYGIINSLGAEITVSQSIFFLFKYDYYISKGNDNRKESYHSSASPGIDRNNKSYYFHLALSTIKLGIGINL